MKILVVGGGGREHAIVKAIKKNDSVKEIFVAPGNGGISKDAVCVDIKATDIENMVKFSKDNNIDFVVVAPDDPLVIGMVDALEQEGIKAFGPNKAAAVLEGSKAFSKDLMKKYGIKTASYEVFQSSDDAINYVVEKNQYPIVIKADGLALGKGVIIAEDKEMAIDGINSIMNDKVFGTSGNKVVIEEFLSGMEVSVLCFCDSKTIKPMISVMDHKRALNGDKGPNTGGMGTIAPNRYYTKEIEKICYDEIFVRTMEAMNSEGRPFKGCIFFGLIICNNVPYVIEYNCRFGDPETQVVLPLLKSDLLDIMMGCVDENLSEKEVEFSDECAVCVVLASGGYPKEYETGIAIDGLNADGGLDDAIVYHAGTKFSNQQFLTSGGRVLGVVAKGDSREKAIENAYKQVKQISFDKCYYRVDIGAK